MTKGSSGNDLTRKERISIIYMPLVIVILTAILGTGIGIWLQNRSFKKNELFKAKLERIMSAQHEAVEETRAVDEARRQIRSNESFIRQELANVSPDRRADALRFYGEQMSPSIAMLKESRLKMDVLGNYTATLSSSKGVPNAIGEFTEKLDDYLRCLEQNVDFGINCSDEHPGVVTSLHAVVAAYSEMADELIDEFG